MWVIVWCSKAGFPQDVQGVFNSFKEACLVAQRMREVSWFSYGEYYIKEMLTGEDVCF